MLRKRFLVDKIFGNRCSGACPVTYRATMGLWDVFSSMIDQETLKDLAEESSVLRGRRVGLLT